MQKYCPLSFFETLNVLCFLLEFWTMKLFNSIVFCFVHCESKVTAVTMKIVICWYVILCNSIGVHHNFEEMYCLHLQAVISHWLCLCALLTFITSWFFVQGLLSLLLAELTLQPWRRRQCILQDVGDFLLHYMVLHPRR